MVKRRTKKQSVKATVAEVTREMAKPRVAMSAREHGRSFQNKLLVVKNNVEK